MVVSWQHKQLVARTLAGYPCSLHHCISHFYFDRSEGLPKEADDHQLNIFAAIFPLLTGRQARFASFALVGV
jgi:hypothetical protein